MTFHILFFNISIKFCMIKNLFTVSLNLGFYLLLLPLLSHLGRNISILEQRSFKAKGNIRHVTYLDYESKSLIK